MNYQWIFTMKHTKYTKDSTRKLVFVMLSEVKHPLDDNEKTLRFAQGNITFLQLSHEIQG